MCIELGLETAACTHTACLSPPIFTHNLQAVGAMLACDAFARQLSDLEQLAVVLAAAMHDVGHPGVNNDFLIRTQSEVRWWGWVGQGLASRGGGQSGELLVRGQPPRDGQAMLFRKAGSADSPERLPVSMCVMLQA